MLKVGITGGIGSGKSTVAALFENLGIPVYYADTEAQRLMNEDLKVVEAIKKEFGERSYNQNTIDKKFLSALIYKNPSKRLALNKIVHPATIANAQKWMDNQKCEYCIKEAALIFESHSNADLDFVIGVSAPLDLRINRVIKRNSISREKVIAIIESQMDETQKMNLCDFVIMNNETQFLLPQVIKIHQQLLSMIHH